MEKTKLWAILHGLKLAHECMVKRLHVESDLEVVVNWIKRPGKQRTQTVNIVEICHKEMNQFEEIHITLNFREQNRATDHLADHALIRCA